MPKDWWSQYWWVLASLLYVILAGLVVTRTSDRTRRNFVFATACVLILLLPTLHPPLSYVQAVLIVLGLLLYRWSLHRRPFKSDISSNPENR